MKKLLPILVTALPICLLIIFLSIFLLGYPEFHNSINDLFFKQSVEPIEPVVKPTIEIVKKDPGDDTVDTKNTKKIIEDLKTDTSENYFNNDPSENNENSNSINEDNNSVNNDNVMPKNPISNMPGNSDFVINAKNRGLACILDTPNRRIIAPNLVPQINENQGQINNNAQVIVRQNNTPLNNDNGSSIGSNIDDK